jgi:hypothetical protein
MNTDPLTVTVNGHTSLDSVQLTFPTAQLKPVPPPCKGQTCS